MLLYLNGEHLFGLMVIFFFIMFISVMMSKKSKNEKSDS